MLLYGCVCLCVCVYGCLTCVFLCVCLCARAGLLIAGGEGRRIAFGCGAVQPEKRTAARSHHVSNKKVNNTERIPPGIRVSRRLGRLLSNSCSEDYAPPRHLLFCRQQFFKDRGRRRISPETAPVGGPTYASLPFSTNRRKSQRERERKKAGVEVFFQHSKQRSQQHQRSTSMDHRKYVSVVGVSEGFCRSSTLRAKRIRVEKSTKRSLRPLPIHAHTTPPTLPLVYGRCNKGSATARAMETQQRKPFTSLRDNNNNNQEAPPPHPTIPPPRYCLPFCPLRNPGHQHPRRG